MKKNKNKSVPANQSSSAQGANYTAAQNDAKSGQNKAKPTMKK